MLGVRSRRKGRGNASEGDKALNQPESDEQERRDLTLNMRHTDGYHEEEDCSATKVKQPWMSNKSLWPSGSQHNKRT